MPNSAHTAAAVKAVFHPAIVPASPHAVAAIEATARTAASAARAGQGPRGLAGTRASITGVIDPRARDLNHQLFRCTSKYRRIRPQASSADGSW